MPEALCTPAPACSGCDDALARVRTTGKPARCPACSGLIPPLQAHLPAEHPWRPSETQLRALAEMGRGMARGVCEIWVVESAVAVYLQAAWCPQHQRGQAADDMIRYAKAAADAEAARRERAESGIYRSVRPLIDAAFPKQQIEDAALQANEGVFREWEVWPLLRLYVAERRRFQRRPNRTIRR